MRAAIAIMLARPTFPTRQTTFNIGSDHLVRRLFYIVTLTFYRVTHSDEVEMQHSSNASDASYKRPASEGGGRSRTKRAKYTSAAWCVSL
jgi:hypothetical protein